MLVDRESEVEVLSALLAGAREGRSAVLVLRGEAGIGKSALLECAVGLADGFRVLRARGVEAESEIAFAGLQELVWPVIELLSGLPERQRAVLEGALALGPPVPGDPLAVRAATLSLLAAAAEEWPLVVVVDDAHWLDPPSAEALAFAARRLDMEGVVALFAMRESESGAFDPAGLRELRVGRLGDQAARTLLTEHAPGPIAAEVVEQLVEVAAGNPLALLELPGALSEGQLVGREPLEEPLPVGAGAERAFARRLQHLPADARDALLIAAAAEQDGGAALASALRTQGLSDAALAPAERVDLVAISDGRVRFTHPLVRSVVYQSATGEQRRAAHAALAAASDETADRRAWHLAAAATGPDEKIAAALEDAAQRAAARGGLATAARTYERAAGLTSKTEVRAQRLLAAATFAHATGSLAWASELVLAGQPLANTAIRADFQQLAAAVERDRGSVRRARMMLWDTAAAIADEDPTRATLMLVDAMIADIMSGDLGAAAESGERAQEHAESSSQAIRRMAHVAANVVANFRGLLPADQVHIQTFRKTVASSPELPASAAVASEILWAFWYAQAEIQQRVGDDALTRAIAAARERGAIGTLPLLLGEGANVEVKEGHWGRATARAIEAGELARDVGQPTLHAWGLLNVAWIDAPRGRENECRAHASQASELARASHAGALDVSVCAVLGLLELGLGNISAALEQLERCARHAEDYALGNPNVVRYEPDLVEALCAAGRNQDAHHAAELLQQRAHRVRSPWGLATAARCRGLLAEQDTYNEHFQLALTLHDLVPSAFERARTQLCYGERLRRHRRRSDAREQLTQALATFEHLAAEPWAERTRRELRAMGIAVRAHRDDSPIETLTPQELRVALIIANGATIREAATQLFLSPKTIEAHLGRAYRKLGVRNRAQLTATIARYEAIAA